MAKKLRKEFKKPGIYTQRCYAHADHLTLKNSMKKFEGCKNLDKVCNILYTFYKSSHKRFQSLVEFQEENEEEIFRLSYIFDVRWISSHLAAIMKVFKNWANLVGHLDEIISSPKRFSKATINGATKLKHWLTNKNFLSLLPMNIDIQTLLKFMSLKYQRKFDSVIGHGDDRAKLEANLENMKIQDGPNLKSLLSNCHCVQSKIQAEEIIATPIEDQSYDLDGCKSLEDYEKSFVVYKNVLLHDSVLEDVDEEIVIEEIESDDEDEDDDYDEDEDDDPDEEMDQDVTDENDPNQVNQQNDQGPVDTTEEENGGQKPKKKDFKFDPLSSYRQLYISTIMEKLEFYFPRKLLKDFDLFDQRKWKEGVMVVDQFSQSWRQMKNLLAYFNIKYKPSFFQNFKVLAEALMNPKYYPNWCTQRSSLPSLFWMNVLGSKIYIDPDIRLLVQTLIVIPLGSSEAERAFR